MDQWIKIHIILCHTKDSIIAKAHRSYDASYVLNEKKEINNVFV